MPRQWVLVVALAIALGWNVAASADEPIAWIRFDQGDRVETYQEVPYVWLGRATVRLQVDAAPKKGDKLAIHWGAKNDRREAIVTVNGVALPVAAGGYDGFRWIVVDIPGKAIDGAKGYEISLGSGHGKAAFVHELRLVNDAAPYENAEPPPVEASSKNATLQLVPPAPPEAFPEMRAVWDASPEHPSPPLDDAKLEAAFQKAERNARRASEALYRCNRFVHGWLDNTADPTTGLIPRNIKNENDADIWNAKDSAADNYPFMVLTARLTDRELFDGRMHDMLATETRVTSRLDRLPDTYRFSTETFADAEPDLFRMLFGGSEYVKDGLLPLTEWLGESPWSDRMLGIVDDIWKHADVDTPHGEIPTTNVEVHGEMLQSLSRIHWMTGDEKYLDWAIRLGDYYLLGDHHPTRDLPELRLRDHGCEIVSGLCELYVAVHFARPEKKTAYREPIHQMLDDILAHGRDERGMLYNTFSATRGEHANGICDTWGYNYNGFHAVYLVDGVGRYREAVRLPLSNLRDKLTDYDWGNADEYADSIEGAINLFNREPVATVDEWIDSEIRDMWSRQQPSGIIEGWHGDGNSARTNIMYAMWKTQGLRVEPWRADVRVGAEMHDGELCVSLMADDDWKGRLLFDTPRHRTQMKLPIDYPRINQFPEWFTVDEDADYLVQDVNAQETAAIADQKLLGGFEIELRAGAERRLIVRKR